MTEKKKIEEKEVLENLEKGSRNQPENKFSKDQLLSSGRFRNRRDLVDALLEDGKLYTAKDVEELIQNYMKGKVK